MTWQRAPVAAAICSTLNAATEGAVACFPDPPPTFNVPAYIVAWEDLVRFSVPIMGVDTATVAVLAAAGTEETARVDDMLNVARSALEADLTLGGVLDHGVLTVTERRGWRILADVGGARFLAAELVVEVRM